MLSFRACAPGAILLLVIHAHAVTVLDDDMRTLEKIDREIIYPEAKIPPLKQQYDKIRSRVESIGLHNLDEADAKDFYQASYTMSFYSHDRAYAREMRAAFDELQGRHLETLRTREEMLSTYVASRMFEEAMSFKSQPANAGLSQAPSFRDEHHKAGSPTLLRVSDDGLLVTRHSHPIANGVQLIVVSSPACHFSREAATAISQDPRFRLSWHATRRGSPPKRLWRTSLRSLDGTRNMRVRVWRRYISRRNGR